MLFPVLGNIYSNLIKEYKTLRNHNFHMVRKEVAWILNIIAKKIWMQSVFNLRIQTAEHSHWVYRLDVFWAWINIVQWQKLLFVMSIPPNICKWSALNTRGWTHSYSSGLLPWETGSAADPATVLQSPAKQIAQTRPLRATNGVFFIFCLAELAVPGHWFVYMPRQLKSAITPIRAH